MKKGFTVLEVLVYTAIFTLVVGAFITMLVAITQVQTRQSASAEVEQQSQFLLQQLQYYIQGASLVELVQDTATSTLKLRMTASSTDPTIITLNGGVVYLQQGSGAQQPLTTNKVSVSNVTFTKRSNAPSHDSVDVAFTVAYNTSNVTQAFSQALQTSIARVSAATFDSDIRASSTNTYKIGASTQEWQSINSTIYFNGANVGVGVITPNAKLQVSGGDVYIDTNPKGLILRDSGSVCWRVTISTGGVLQTATTTCP